MSLLKRWQTLRSPRPLSIHRFGLLVMLQSVLNSVAEGTAPFEVLATVDTVFESIQTLFDSMGASSGGWEPVRASR